MVVCMLVLSKHVNEALKLVQQVISLNGTSYVLKGQLKWKIDLCLNNRLVTAKQIGIDSSGISHLVELLQTIEHLQEMLSQNVTPRMRAWVLLHKCIVK